MTAASEGRLPISPAVAEMLRHRDGVLDEILERPRPDRFDNPPPPAVQPEPQPFRHTPAPTGMQEERERQARERALKEAGARRRDRGRVRRSWPPRPPRRTPTPARRAVRGLHGTGDAQVTVTAVRTILLSADGLASAGGLGHDWRTRTVAWANPACELRRYHDPAVAGQPRGALQRHAYRRDRWRPPRRRQGRHRRLADSRAHRRRACDGLLDYPDPIYFSAETDAAFSHGWVVGHDIKLLGAAVTTRPARLCARLEAVSLFPGGLSSRSRWSVNGAVRVAVDETISQVRHRHDSKVLYVSGWRDPDDDDEAQYYPRAAESSYVPSRPAGALRHSAHRGSILSVR